MRRGLEIITVEVLGKSMRRQRRNLAAILKTETLALSNRFRF
jgi:hypothetical protein